MRSVVDCVSCALGVIVRDLCMAWVAERQGSLHALSMCILRGLLVCGPLETKVGLGAWHSVACDSLEYCPGPNEECGCGLTYVPVVE